MSDACECGHQLLNHDLQGRCTFGECRCTMMRRETAERPPLPEGEGYCDCGAQLAHCNGGLLCTECDKEHLEELLAATPLQLLEEALHRQGELLKRLEAALQLRPTEARMRRAADVLDKLASDELRSQLVGPYDVDEWQEHVEGSRSVAEWLRDMALTT